MLLLLDPGWYKDLISELIELVEGVGLSNEFVTLLIREGDCSKFLSKDTASAVKRLLSAIDG
jgi:hypothetical protein